MECEIGEHESVSVAVVRSVSAVEGLEPCSLQPLSEVLDTDALDTLFAPRWNGESRPGGRVSFVYSRSRVTVDSGEFLTIQLLEDRARAVPPFESEQRSVTGRESDGDGRY